MGGTREMASSRARLALGVLVAVLVGSGAPTTAAPPLPGPPAGTLLGAAPNLVTAPATAAAVPAPRLGVHRLAVVLLRAKNSIIRDPFTAEDAQRVVFGAHNSVASFYNEVSGGALTMSGRVFGMYDSNVAGNECAYTTWGPEAEQRAAVDGYRAADFDHLVVVVSRSVCGFAGQNTIGTRVANIKVLRADVIAHELGHSLGLAHAQSQTCEQSPIAGNCYYNDYGDPYDTMGTNFRQFQAWSKSQLGFLPQSNVKTITASSNTVIQLTPSETVAGGTTQLVVVPRADGTKYAIETRASIGEYDDGVRPAVWVRTVTGPGQTTQLLDMTPDAGHSVGDGDLAPGITFSDPANQITMRTLSVDGNGAELQVCVRVTRCDSASPTPRTRVEMRGSTLTFRDGAGSADHVSIRKLRKGTYEVSDPGVVLSPAGGTCRAVGATVQCTGVSAIDIDLGAGNDTATVFDKIKTTYHGGAGDDTVVFTNRTAARISIIGADVEHVTTRKK